MNLITKNCIYEKIYIYSNNIDDKYNWLQNKFRNDVFIYLNEIDFDKIDKNYINLIIFDDLLFSKFVSINQIHGDGFLSNLFRSIPILNRIF